MVVQPFGDQYTKRKLETVEKYLQPYSTALKNKSFTLLYVDACAGSGASIPKSATKAEEEDRQKALEGFGAPVLDTDQIVIGSAIRALSIHPPFHRYLFNDLNRTNVEALNQAIDKSFPHLWDRIEITQLDANAMLQKMCSTYDWNETRAVVFLDPFLQINYETLQMLGSTRAVDLWYLVPVFAMYRQISGEGQINPDGGPRVDAALGTTAWRDVAVMTEEGGSDLFAQSHFKTKRAVDIQWFEKIARERIGAAFGGRVLEETLPLGKNGVHYFSLMFAWANSSERAENLAKRLARAVLK